MTTLVGEGPQSRPPLICRFLVKFRSIRLLVSTANVTQHCAQVQGMFAEVLERPSVRLRLQKTWLYYYNAYLVEKSLFPRERPRICRRCYAQAIANAGDTSFANSKRIRRQARQAAKPLANKFEEARALDTSTVLQLRLACSSGRLSEIVSAYNAITNKRLLSRSALFGVAQALHGLLRKWRRPSMLESRKTTEGDVIVALAEQLVKDLRMGFLQPSFGAHVHLLSIFKEKQGDAIQSGIRFWEWLRQQDETVVSSGAYGAAIELLAVTGSPLEELELLYQEALRRFPGNFSTYHLSPHAMVPDRSQPVNLKHLPITLLNGITIARVLHGDSRNAYMSLDTLLRLLPSQVSPRLIAIIMEKRPLLEAFTVFAMACRSGVAVPKYDTSQMLFRCRRGVDDRLSQQAKIFNLRAMISASYLCLGAGGRLENAQLDALIIATVEVLKDDSITLMSIGDKSKLSDDLLGLIRRLLEFFAKLGVTPGTPAFDAIIKVLGGMKKGLIAVVQSDMAALGLETTTSSRRSVLSAAGRLGDAELVKETWHQLVLSQSGSMGCADLHCLIDAAHAASSLPWARERWKEHMDNFPKGQRIGVWNHLDKVSQPPRESADTMRDETNVEAMLDALRHIEADIDALEGLRAGSGLNVADWSSVQLPMELLPTMAAVIPLDLQRKLYDEVTSDHSAAAVDTGPDVDTIDDDTGDHSATADAPLARSEGSFGSLRTSPTNIPLDNLRFENWRSINTLLSWASQHDKAHHRDVLRALDEGRAPARMRTDLAFSLDNGVVRGDLDWGKHVGLSEHRDDVKGQSGTSKDFEQWRRSVLGLRGYDVDAQSST